MSNVEYIDIFNSKVIEFFQQLSVYDNIVNFTMYKNSVIASILIDKYSIRNMFNVTVVKDYSEKITSKSDTFFLEQTYEEWNQQDISIINAIKKIWVEIDNISKNCIWDYLNVLLYLNKKIL
jgi:hypothetical protein